MNGPCPGFPVERTCTKRERAPLFASALAARQTYEPHPPDAAGAGGGIKSWAHRAPEVESLRAFLELDLAGASTIREPSLLMEPSR